ncbi:MAG: hypothetical protein GY810_29000 [Aureispira sp.]|nr:hypothetical protein [Aureispira sp.]
MSDTPNDTNKMQKIEGLLENYVSLYRDKKEALKIPRIKKQYTSAVKQLQLVKALRAKEKLKTIHTHLDFSQLPQMKLNLGYRGFDAPPLQWESNQNNHKIELKTENALSLFPNHCADGTATVLETNGHFIKHVSIPLSSDLELRFRPLWRSTGFDVPCTLTANYSKDSGFEGDLKMGIEVISIAEIETAVVDPLLMAEAGIEANISARVVSEIKGGFKKDENNIAISGQAQFELTLKGDTLAHIDLSKNGQAAYHCLSSKDMDDLGIVNSQNDITRIFELELDDIELLKVKMSASFDAYGLRISVLDVIPLGSALSDFGQEAKVVFKALDDAWLVYEKWALEHTMETREIAEKTYAYFSKPYKQLRETNLNSWNNKESAKKISKYIQTCRRIAKEYIRKEDIVQQLIRFKGSGDVRSAKACLLKAIKGDSLAQKIHKKLFVLHDKKRKKTVPFVEN